MTTIYNPIGYARNMKLEVKTVSLQDALAVAYAAYRINNNTYTKDLRRFSTEENKTQFDNKSLIRFYWTKKLDTSEIGRASCRERV